MLAYDVMPIWKLTDSARKESKDEKAFMSPRRNISSPMSVAMICVTPSTSRGECIQYTSLFSSMVRLETQWQNSWHIARENNFGNCSSEANSEALNKAEAKSIETMLDIGHVIAKAPLKLHVSDVSGAMIRVPGLNL